MIKPTLVAALNKQIQHEQTNAHAYQAVSLYFATLNLHGIEGFFAQQVNDETTHANKFIQFLQDRGGRVELTSIPAPKNTFATPLEAVKLVRDMEHGTTEAIRNLLDLARKEADMTLEARLQWFIEEQVEEEQWADELTTLMEQFNDHPGQLFMLDHSWGKRVKKA